MARVAGVVVVTVRSNDFIERLRLAGYRHVPRGAAGLRPHDLKQLPKIFTHSKIWSANVSDHPPDVTQGNILPIDVERLAKRQEATNAGY